LPGKKHKTRQRRSGVKVSWNAPERRSGARKFKPGAFWLQNYRILQPERTLAAFVIVIP